MTTKFTSVFVAIFVFLFLAFASVASAEVIHQERSVYRNIFVEDAHDLRCLKFDVKNSLTHQSCMLISDPQYLVFNYTKLLFSSLLVTPEPKRVLIIGLGGGTMSNTIHQLFPDAVIDNVEIDQAVINVARKYFGYFENNKINTHVKDGRIFIKRAALKKQQYDWIILDAFNGDYIPEHLLTQEFLTEAKSLLTDDGVLASNTFSVSKLYAHESATYQKVFGEFYNVKNPNQANRIILARKTAFPDMATINKRAKALDSSLNEFGIDIEKIANNMESTQFYQDWPKDTKVLTDQFSPANLLNLSND